MSLSRVDLAGIAGHPDLLGLSPARDAAGLAQDLAVWLAGVEPSESLGVAARVVITLGGRALDEARRVCWGQPWIAMGLAARLTRAAWSDLAPGPSSRVPLLTGPGAAEGSGDAAQPVSSGLGAMIAGAVDALGDLVDEVADLDAMLAGLNAGAGPGALQRLLLSDVGRMAEALRALPELRALARALGRVEGAARTPMPRGGSGAIRGVTLGGDIERALASERALLADPDLEDLALARLADRRMLSLARDGDGPRSGRDGRRLGPVMMALDTSGSMVGEPELLARAAVLAVCRQVLPQGRAVHLIAFGSRDELREVRLRRGPASVLRLVEALSWGFGGGTDFDAPLARALDLLVDEDLREADVLLVTDGQGAASRALTDRLRGVVATRGMRVWGLLTASQPGGVAALSDRVVQLGAQGGQPWIRALSGREARR